MEHFGARAPRRRVRGEVQQEVERLAELGWTPAQITRRLKSLVGQGLPGQQYVLVADDLPHPKTVERIASAARGDTSGDWSIRDSRPEDARPVLEVAHIVNLATDGRIRLSREEGEWVARLRAIRPEVTDPVALFGMWHCARQAIRLSASGAGTLPMECRVLTMPQADLREMGVGMIVLSEVLKEGGPVMVALTELLNKGKEGTI